MTQGGVLEVIRKEGIGYTQDGRSIPWTEVYIKIKVAFRQKALALLKGPKLSCFLCIALHIGEDGTANPSIDTIVRETGYKRPTVCKALAELEALGFIEKTRRRHDTTLYRVRGYAWFGKSGKSKANLLLDEERRLKVGSSKSSLSKRLRNEPKDYPNIKDKPEYKDYKPRSQKQNDSSLLSEKDSPDDWLPPAEEQMKVLAAGSLKAKELEAYRRLDELYARLKGIEVPEDEWRSERWHLAWKRVLNPLRWDTGKALEALRLMATDPKKADWLGQTSSPLAIVEDLIDIAQSGRLSSRDDELREEAKLCNATAFPRDVCPYQGAPTWPFPKCRFCPRFQGNKQSAKERALLAEAA